MTERAKQLWPAPAKINLFLYITGRQADGYHDLQTLFQILDWGDELSFTANETGKISRDCNIDGIPLKRDICVHAARLLQRRCNIEQGVHIELTKRVPLGAGLGGGSSDAATTLCALNELWSCGLTRQQLADLGLELGADVPVFVNGYSALGQGRGEKLQTVEMGPRFYVLIFPDINISTADVFQHPLLTRNSKSINLAKASLTGGRNDCLEVVLMLYPELETLLEELRSYGEPFMSGTGSTFFLQFSGKNAAINAASDLKCRYNVRAVEGVDRSPLLDSVSASW